MVVRERVRGEALPEVNSLVRITIGPSSGPEGDPEGSDVPSRVEDVVPGRATAKPPVPTLIYVAVPSYSGGVCVPPEGTACSLAWLTPNGVYELPTTFHGRERVGPAVKAWKLAVIGGAVRSQRRRFVRVAWSGTVRIEAALAADGTEQTLVGHGIDLSEGGVRCVLPLPQLEIGHEVNVVLVLPGPERDGVEEMTLVAQVVRAEATVTPLGRMVQTSLGFTDPEAFGDVLRKLVFSTQLRARRAGLA